MEFLPSEIVLDIVSRLPVESVLDCKLVCKNFLNILTSRRNDFAKMHHHRQLLQLSDGHEAAVAASSTVKVGLLLSLIKSGVESVGFYYWDKFNDEMDIHENFCYKELKITNIYSRPLTWDNYPERFLVGSCNGLICLLRYQDEPHKFIYICNPITGEYVILPEHNQNSSVIGFGYVVHSAITCEYKVVSYYPNDLRNGEVQVYTIGSGRGWRTKKTASYSLKFPNPVGVFANGALHWIQDKDIVAFSLEDEEFRLVQSVPCLHPLQYSCDYELQALGGKLCLSQDKYLEHRLNIWSLQRNGMEESWTKDFSIAYRSTNDFGMMPLSVTKKNKVLLLQGGSILYCYDPETTSVIRLRGDDSKTTKMVRALPHMNSFISLKALGEDSKIKNEDIEAV